MHSSNRSFVARHGKLVTEMQEASARVSHLEDEKKQMVREMTSLKKELKSSKKEIQDLVQRSGRLEHDVEVLVKERVDNGLALHGTPILPLEILVIVGQSLADAGYFGTLASFSTICKIIHQEILPTLCETVILGSNAVGLFEKGNILGDFFGRQGKHTKHIVLPERHRHESSFSKILPNLTVIVWKGGLSRVCGFTLADSDKIVTPLSAIVRGPVSASLLDLLLGFSSLGKVRTCGSSTAHPSSPTKNFLRHLEVKEHGRILHVDQRHSCSWSLHDEGTALAYVSLSNMTEGFKQSIEYLYRGIPSLSLSLTDTPIQYLRIRRDVLDIADYDLLVGSFDELLHQRQDVRLNIRMNVCQISIDQLTERMPALATIAKKHWPRVMKTLLEHEMSAQALSNPKGPAQEAEELLWHLSDEDSEFEDHNNDDDRDYARLKSLIFIEISNGRLHESLRVSLKVLPRTTLENESYGGCRLVLANARGEKAYDQTYILARCDILPNV